MHYSFSEQTYAKSEKKCNERGRKGLEIFFEEKGSKWVLNLKGNSSNAILNLPQSSNRHITSRNIIVNTLSLFIGIESVAFS